MLNQEHSGGETMNKIFFIMLVIFAIIPLFDREEGKLEKNDREFDY